MTGNYYTIDETENMMEYDIEVLDDEGEQPSNWDDILEAFEEARQGGLINTTFEWTPKSWNS